MKKSCYKCKALEDIGNHAAKYVCELGYKQEKAIPLEKCPKPVSTKKFVEELNKNK